MESIGFPTKQHFDAQHTEWKLAAGGRERGKRDQLINNRWTMLKRTWKKILSGRAAGAATAAATVFLCCFTLLEFTAIVMEWEVPALMALGGDGAGGWFAEYRREEMALDDSPENEFVMPSSVSTEEIMATEEMESGGTESSGTESGETQAAEFPYYIKVNRKRNSITIYTMDESGDYTIPCKAMVCSTGLYNATPRGIYHLSDKYLWRELYGGVYGQYATRITGGILFHSVPYYRKTKNSLCTEKYNKLGEQASMGCIRLTVEDAKWIADNCPSGTAVEIYDDDDPGPLGKPEALKINPDSPDRGWDPTDPDEENPWHEMPAVE